jgi:hypothetical protein
MSLRWARAVAEAMLFGAANAGANVGGWQLGCA